MAKQQRTLSEWREIRGKTVQQMADALGVSRGHMGNYIQGRAEPRISRAIEIAKILNVAVEDIRWSPERSSLEINNRLINASMARKKYFE